MRAFHRAGLPRAVRPRPLTLLFLLFTLALGVAGVAVLPRTAAASLVIALDTPAMVQRADHIALCDVVSTSAAWDDKHERILTTIELSVVETWKGPMAPATHVKLVQPGGTVGDLTMVVFGMTRFSPGERSLVFLQGRPENASVVGMAQGKRLVARDAATGRWVVHAPDRAGASFVRALPAAGASTPASTSTPAVFDMRARPLDELRGEIRELVAKAPRQ